MENENALDLGNLASSIDVDLDFNMSDFDLFQGENFQITTEPQERICRPKINVEDISHCTTFENAETFADQVSLDPHERTFAWVNGNFIFGDILPALVTRRGVQPRYLYIASLSLSQDNIDAIAVMLECLHIERLVIFLSAYFYSHEKFRLVKYMYDLIGGDDRVQIVFGTYHMKFITMETHRGNTLTIHGSANLRSSNSFEQIMFEQDRTIYEFNRDIMEAIAAKYGTINYNVKPDIKAKAVKDQWQVAAHAGMVDGEGARSEAPPM